MRVNLLRYKAVRLADLFERAIHETLARTVMTSLTTLLALVALAVLGGPIIRGFTIAMIWGVLIGTYSTVYVASPMILHLRLPHDAAAPEVAEPAPCGGGGAAAARLSSCGT